jgi:hypothetical protein
MSCRISTVLKIVIGAVALVSMAAHSAPQTPPSAPVTVVNTPANPIPVTAPSALPVTGTVNVGNLGATTLPVSVTNFPATQPVSVTNFPATQQVSGSVNVGNLPTVQQVSVTNVSSAPVIAVMLNVPGSNPFVTVLDPQTPEFDVPSTLSGRSVQSLVVTQVSGGCTGIGSFQLPLQDTVSGNVVAEFLFRVGTLEGGFFPLLAQQTQIYFGPGHSVVLGDAVAGNGCQFDLSGYFVTQ